eukprot:g7331.t1
MVGLCKTKVCTFTMGGDVKSGSPGTRDVQLQSYKIDRTSVTNQMFRMYVKETKYKTESEHFGWSFVFDPLVSKTVRQNNPRTLERGGQHWRAIESAYWRQPEGVDSNLKERWDYPAVHISKNDAEQYCEYYGLRLPTEAEWEYAARGGIGLYPWGDGTRPFLNGKWMMNVYNGTNFPHDDTGMDGYVNVCPANAFGPNNYEIYNMLGNIWEWTQSTFVTENPKYNQFVLKGGSFIDSVDGNVNHKVTATTRMGNTADAGSNNIGFRCVRGSGGGRKAPPDKKKMQEIIAESGVEEGVQEYLASQGSNAQVMSAIDLADNLLTKTGLK